MSEQLQKAADEGAGRHADNGWLPEAGHDEGERDPADDGTQVEEAGGYGGNEKTVFAVQYTHHHSRQGDKDKEGKHDNRQVLGESDLAGNPGKIRGDKHDDGPGKTHADNGDNRENYPYADYDVIGQPPGGGGSSVLVVIREDSDKGGAQSPFAKKVAQEVGNAEGDHKGVIVGTGAEEGGHNLFPYQAEESAAHNGGTYYSGGAGEAAAVF